MKCIGTRSDGSTQNNSDITNMSTCDPFIKLLKFRKSIDMDMCGDMYSDDMWVNLFDELYKRIGKSETNALNLAIYKFNTE